MNFDGKNGFTITRKSDWIYFIKLCTTHNVVHIPDDRLPLALEVTDLTFLAFHKVSQVVADNAWVSSYQPTEWKKRKGLTNNAED